MTRWRFARPASGRTTRASLRTRTLWVGPTSCYGDKLRPPSWNAVHASAARSEAFVLQRIRMFVRQTRRRCRMANESMQLARLRLAAERARGWTDCSSRNDGSLWLDVLGARCVGRLECISAHFERWPAKLLDRLVISRTGMLEWQLSHDGRNAGVRLGSGDAAHVGYCSSQRCDLWARPSP